MGCKSTQHHRLHRHVHGPEAYQHCQQTMGGSQEHETPPLASTITLARKGTTGSGRASAVRRGQLIGGHGKRVLLLLPQQGLSAHAYRTPVTLPVTARRRRLDVMRVGQSTSEIQRRSNRPCAVQREFKAATQQTTHTHTHIHTRTHTHIHTHTHTHVSPDLGIATSTAEEDARVMARPRVSTKVQFPSISNSMPLDPGHCVGNLSHSRVRRW